MAQTGFRTIGNAPNLIQHLNGLCFGPLLIIVSCAFAVRLSPWDLPIGMTSLKQGWGNLVPKVLAVHPLQDQRRSLFYLSSFLAGYCHGVSSIHQFIGSCCGGGIVPPWYGRQGLWVRWWRPLGRGAEGSWSCTVDGNLSWWSQVLGWMMRCWNDGSVKGRGSVARGCSWGKLHSPRYVKAADCQSWWPLEKICCLMRIPLTEH